MKLEIVPVSSVDEVLSNALTREPVPVDWEGEEDDIAPVGGAKPDVEDIVTH